MRKIIEYLDNGLELVKEFYDGVLYTEYHLLDGKRHGKEIIYYKNGNIEMECMWIDGALDGEDIGYDEEGNIVEVIHYESGELKYIDFYNNGKLIE